MSMAYHEKRGEIDVLAFGKTLCLTGKQFRKEVGQDPAAEK
jgi:hypothetical protein